MPVFDLGMSFGKVKKSLEVYIQNCVAILSAFSLTPMSARLSKCFAETFRTKTQTRHGSLAMLASRERAARRSLNLLFFAQLEMDEIFNPDFVTVDRVLDVTQHAGDDGQVRFARSCFHHQLGALRDVRGRRRLCLSWRALIAVARWSRECVTSAEATARDSQWLWSLLTVSCARARCLRGLLQDRYLRLPASVAS